MSASIFCRATKRITRCRSFLVVSLACSLSLGALQNLFLNRRMLAYDRRSEPRVGERVPYVIVYGMPGLPLIQLVRRPTEVLQDPSLRLNATYYITKQILPPLARVFSLIGIDVFSWYHELPRVSVSEIKCDRKCSVSVQCLVLSWFFTQ